MAIRVLIVDDHSVVREGLRMFLERDPVLDVVGEAANGAEAIQQARLLRPDVIVMDLLMPGMDGVAATRTIHTELPGIEVLALTSALESTLAVEAIRAGAIGYFFKDAQAAELRAAVKAAGAGQVQLSPQAAAFLMSAVRETAQLEPLTPREMDVLHLLAQGQSNRDIARSLHLVEETVKSHVKHILGKLGVQSRTQAALAAIRMGVIAPSSLARDATRNHAHEAGKVAQ